MLQFPIYEAEMIILHRAVVRTNTFKTVKHSVTTVIWVRYIRERRKPFSYTTYGLCRPKRY